LHPIGALSHSGGTELVRRHDLRQTGVPGWLFGGMSPVDQRSLEPRPDQINRLILNRKRANFVAG
jgi:hypothetical protein